MKKAISVLTAIMMILALFGCARQTSVKSDSPSSQSNAVGSSETVSQNPQNDKKILVAYFTWSGNTKDMAQYIAEQTGGDLLEITPSEPYPTDYGETGDIAKEERDDNARPKIANLPESLEQYDTILIGYPIWWHTAPMIIGTFLENYDLTGKNVYPFTQSSSMDTEQFNSSMDFVRECAKGATVHDGLFVKSSNTNGISSYLKDNGLSK